MKSIGPISLAESFYGPTYHIKDFSMQFIGHFLKYLVHKDEENDSVWIGGAFHCSVRFMQWSLEQTVTLAHPCLLESVLLTIV